MGFEFYYDRYLNNPNLTFRLVGTKLKPSSGYGKADSLVDEPQVILKDVITNPLQVSVTHDYEYAKPSLENFRANWEAFTKNFQVTLQKSTVEWQNIVDEIFDKEGGYSSPLKGALVFTNSDFFKNYAGTEVSIPLSFNSRLYRRKVDGVLTSPSQQLEKVNEYFMGVSFEGEATSKDKSTTSSTSVKMFSAPHGYIGTSSQGWQPTGTLSLYYGKHAVLDDLLLREYSFQYSRELGSDGGPLYIDLSFTLIPALIYTKENLDVLTSLTQDRREDRREAYDKVGGISNVH